MSLFREKSCIRVLRPALTKNDLFSLRGHLQAPNLTYEPRREKTNNLDSDTRLYKLLEMARGLKF